MKDLSILEDPALETKAKYLYLYLLIVSKGDKYTLSLAEMCINLGLTPGMLYRARGQLINRRLINLSHNFCIDTGRKISDVYEITY